MKGEITKNDLEKINDWLWEIPKDFRPEMRVPARIYASEEMLKEILGDRSLEQIVNVASLPNIQNYALAMPDIHEGYGFPIGGVAAFDIEEGVISPGGIGYDINCGVRLLKSSLALDQIRSYLEKLSGAIYQEVPSGVGRSGRLNLKNKDLDAILENGAGGMIKFGYGEEEDLINIESNGRLEEADAAFVSGQAKSRGRNQLGTMGAGNHFVEIETIETIFEPEIASGLGLFKDQAVILIHTGSRGLGHQIATDYIRLMMKVMPRYKITLADRELACVPFRSKEGQQYFKAMAAAANFAWANRELVTWEVRRAWRNILGEAGGDLEIVYDVAHNIAKIEEYGGRKNLVHRKGATRSFPDQPVLIPGSMGSGSFLLLGQPRAMEESFGSSCHGAGRRMSRTQAKKEIRGADLLKKLQEMGIAVNAGSMSGLAEEAPEAYKSVDEVVEVVHNAGLAKKIARMRPLAVIKG
jgi:tRNA-splicing ligase RtcB